ncbi:MAG: DUF1015 domain-containing protein [Planctomycetes bacterium]|nr:DUF1015 domain-containing protein [Planctomycetota bacterium]MBM4057501.1 DUF1015 domain-containing protein [Planctomycetota bacterium]
MPVVAPFRGLRYDPKHVGSLSLVIAPPYDVIDGALQTRLYEQHPANVIRLELNREEPGDGATTNKYSRAARFLRSWREQGVIMEEPAAALYVYHQQFTVEGQTHVRRGVMARIRLERFGSGSIHPHEETMSGPKQDRLLLTRACRTNLSQVFGLYPDPGGEVQALLDGAVAGQPPLEAVDHLGVSGRMWPLTDEAVATRVAGLMAGRPVFIADGHHRYETACNYRDEVAAAWAASHSGAPLPDHHPANYVLMMLVGMSDPGLVVLPTHRLFVEPAVADAATLRSRLGDCFTTEPAGHGPAAADALWSRIEVDGDQGTLGLYTAGDQAWTLARITPAGQRRMDAVAADHGPAWRSLGVSILHRLVIGDLLAAPAIATPTYVHLVREVVEGLGTGRYPLGALVMPATVDDIRLVSETGERMPAKSTYFYPKLASGMVFHALE